MMNIVSNITIIGLFIVLLMLFSKPEESFYQKTVRDTKNYSFKTLDGQAFNLELVNDIRLPDKKCERSDQNKRRLPEPDFKSDKTYVFEADKGRILVASDIPAENLEEQGFPALLYPFEMVGGASSRPTLSRSSFRLIESINGLYYIETALGDRRLIWSDKYTSHPLLFYSGSLSRCGSGAQNKCLFKFVPNKEGLYQIQTSDGSRVVSIIKNKNASGSDLLYLTNPSQCREEMNCNFAIREVSKDMVAREEKQKIEKESQQKKRLDTMQREVKQEQQKEKEQKKEKEESEDIENPVTIYQKDNYGGKKQNFQVGYYEVKNRLSSLKVSPGYRVTLYRDANFSGDTIVFTENQINIPSKWNDSVSGLAVQKSDSLHDIYQIIGTHTYDEAKEKCHQNNGRLATTGELKKAYEDKGHPLHHTCSWGWLDDSKIGINNKVKHPGCGEKGSHTRSNDPGKTEDISSVYCYGPKPVKSQAKDI